LDVTTISHHHPADDGQHSSGDRCGTRPAVGDRVRIERDETRYPPRATWPQYRGRAGVVVEINRDRVRPHLTEWGVCFSAVTVRTDGKGALNWDAASVAWFRSHELTLMCRAASERPADGGGGIPPIDDTGERPCPPRIGGGEAGDP
jgi:hypothetical protein